MDTRQALSAVPHTPALRVSQQISLQRLEAAIAAVPHAQLRMTMMQTLKDMLQSLASFRVLQGAQRPPRMQLGVRHTGAAPHPLAPPVACASP
jgi:hypothetical protein